jgi:hypothetical protein
MDNNVATYDQVNIYSLWNKDLQEHDLLLIEGFEFSARKIITGMLIFIYSD